jgi:hypothetical protein
MTMERPKDLKGLIRAGICPNLWMEHFHDKRPDKAKCEDCEDFKIGVCKGGRDPIQCFMMQKPKIGDIVAMRFGFLGEGPIICLGDCKRCEALALTMIYASLSRRSR